MSADKPNDASEPQVGRRGFLTSAAGSIVAAAVGSTAVADSAEAQSINCAPVSGSVAWKQAGNNHHMLELAKATSTSKGPVTIDYFGHCALKITSPAGKFWSPLTFCFSASDPTRETLHRPMS